MSRKSATIDEKARTITLVMDLDTPAPSKSGKTLIVASTHGSAASTAAVNGQPVIVSVNCYTKK